MFYVHKKTYKRCCEKCNKNVFVCEQFIRYDDWKYAVLISKTTNRDYKNTVLAPICYRTSSKYD